MMGRHAEDDVGASVVAGAVLAALALSLTVPLRAMLVFDPNDPVSIAAAASTARAAGN